LSRPAYKMSNYSVIVYMLIDLREGKAANCIIPGYIDVKSIDTSLRVDRSAI